MLVDGWTHSVTLTEWNACLLQHANETSDADDLDVETAIETSKSVGDAMNRAKEIYETGIYSFETDNASTMVAVGENLKHKAWHIRCKDSEPNGRV